MKQIPIHKNQLPTHNKKAIQLIVVLVICGVLAGLLLSNYFVVESNERLARPEPEGNMPPPKGFNFSFEPEPLTFSDIIIPTVGVVIVSVSTFLLIGLVAIYVKIFFKSKSKYVGGLLFFLSPLLIQSLFSLNALRSLFVSARIPFHSIRESVGFSWGGLGGMLVILSIFEIIGLTILLYLSSE